MAATEGNPSFELIVTDQLQDSPRERSAPARELKRMKFSEVSEDFDNIVLQNQQLIMTTTEAAKSAAYTVNQLSKILKAVLPAVGPQAGRVDPDPTPVGRPPLHRAHLRLNWVNNENQYGRTRCLKSFRLKSFRRSWNDQPTIFANSSDTCTEQRKDWNRRRRR